MPSVFSLLPRQPWCHVSVPCGSPEPHLHLTQLLAEELIVAHGDKLHEHPSTERIGVPDARPQSVGSLLVAPEELMRSYT
jgi:hypothetical protein